MASTGVLVADECRNAYNSLKLSKALRYIVFKVSDDYKEVVVESTGDRSATYEDFLSALTPRDARYAVVDFEFETAEGRRNKILFIAYITDSVSQRKRMVYASSKDALKVALTGISLEIQATEKDELEYDLVLAKVSKGLAIR
ncbi:MULTISPECIES: actin depolymerization factor/cofilin-like domain-containing protein [unclassified Pseudomonas]|uniref:actin-binding ADF family protein n=1 Tax=unclassified Pseudomonas TaxID=196821 RepID=UPI00143D8ACF|nr:actin depolymerization factor/cofilin-like domain-containing protein [Pseudomonas sp. 1239]